LGAAADGRGKRKLGANAAVEVGEAPRFARLAGQVLLGADDDRKRRRSQRGRRDLRRLDELVLIAERVETAGAEVDDVEQKLRAVGDGGGVDGRGEQLAQSVELQEGHLVPGE